MIVKVKNDKNSWSYFECEVIHSKYKMMKELIIRGDECILVEKQIDSDKEKQVRIIRLETIKEHSRTIITDKVVYVINNEGKTIDRI